LPEIIRIAGMMHLRYPISLRNVEVLLHERGVDITHETVRFWWNQFGTIFAAEISQNRVHAMRSFWHRQSESLERPLRGRLRAVWSWGLIAESGHSAWDLTPVV